MNSTPMYFNANNKPKEIESKEDATRSSFLEIQL